MAPGRADDQIKRAEKNILWNSKALERSSVKIQCCFLVLSICSIFPGEDVGFCFLFGLSLSGFVWLFRVIEYFIMY